MNQTKSSFLLPAASCLVWMAIVLQAEAQSGVWTNNVDGNASGSWANAVNWDQGVIAGGAGNTADFSTLDIGANSTVTLDGARTIGRILFGDTAASHHWVLGTGSGGPLTLAAVDSPEIHSAAGGSNTISAALAGTGGYSKTGGGTLRLSVSNPNLQGLVVVSNGVLQIANATAAGTNGNHLSNDRVVCTNGATLEIMNGVQPNNKHLTLSGAGRGGTNGALYASTSGNGTSTRWGLGSLNASGTSANSSAAFPAVTLAGDATIRIDGPSFTAEPIGASGPSFIIGYISNSVPEATLTKTGAGRLNFDRGMLGVSNVVILEGSYVPNSPGQFGTVLYYTVASGAAILNNQGNNTFSPNARIYLHPGALFDINWRGNGNIGSDTTSYSQNIGYLNGSGILTTGSRGNTGAQTLIFNGSESNSVFQGTIAVSNGTFHITKNGTAALVLNGNNTYNGLTTINSGDLVVNGMHTGSGGYRINGGVLRGTGTISSSVTNLAGILHAGDPDATGGKLTLLGNVVGSFGDTLNVSNATLAVNGYIGPDFNSVGVLYMTNGTLELPLRTLGASAFVSTFNVDGAATIKFSMDTPLLGQFPIVSYGFLGGLAGFSGLSLAAPPGITASLVNNTANSTIDVLITGIPALTWDGSPGGTWNVGAGNWKGGAVYSEPGGVGPFVVFDDTAAGTASVNVGGTVSPQGVTVNNNSKLYSFSGAGKISGAGGIAKQGSGTLVVATSGNDFAGGVNLQQGTLQLGDGGSSGDLGSGPIANSGTLSLNRSDSFALPNVVSGNGSITKSGAGSATVQISGDSSGAITVSGGLLQLAPAGTSRISGDVTGPGAFGVTGAGTVILSGFNNLYSGGTVISNGTLQFGDEFGAGALPAGSVVNHGILATTLSGTLNNTISGSGGISILNGAFVTLDGVNTYSGETRVLGNLDVNAIGAYPSGSALTLGSQTGGGQVGVANFNAGNPVTGSLRAGGNGGFVSSIGLNGGNQSLTVNGSLIVGNSGPVGATVGLTVFGAGASLTVVTNGGVIQLGLGVTGSGVNPDGVVVDLSQVDRFTADLGGAGVVNLGTLDGNPGPPAGASVLNQFKLASVSNSITAGTINIGAGGRQLTPELRLGAGINHLNVDTLRLGNNGRDGGALLFDAGTGALRLRATDGVSPATMVVGYGPTSGTGASIANTVDLRGHDSDMLLSSLVIGDLNCGGVYNNQFWFDQGVLVAGSTSLSPRRNTGNQTAIDNAALSSSTLNIGGGTASLGPVSVTASAAAGTLSITGGSVTVQSISDTGAGVGTLDLSGATLNIDLPGFGNPASAPVAVDVFNTGGAVTVGVNGAGLSVGQFPLIQYAGAIGGAGFGALTLGSLPPGVSATLVDNAANASVDLLITAAPAVLNPNPTNIVVTVSGGQLELSWPSDRTGWQLQSNAVGIASSGDWHLVPGSTATNRIFVPIDQARTNVFYRMLKP